MWQPTLSSIFNLDWLLYRRKCKTSLCRCLTRAVLMEAVAAPLVVVVVAVRFTDIETDVVEVVVVLQVPSSSWSLVSHALSTVPMNVNSCWTWLSNSSGRLTTLPLPSSRQHEVDRRSSCLIPNSFTGLSVKWTVLWRRRRDNSTALSPPRFSTLVSSFFAVVFDEPDLSTIRRILDPHLDAVDSTILLSLSVLPAFESTAAL